MLSQDRSEGVGRADTDSRFGEFSVASWFETCFGCRRLVAVRARDSLGHFIILCFVQVLACFLLLALAGRDEVGAAPGSRERRESKSEAQQNFDPISINDRITHFGRIFFCYL